MIGRSWTVRVRIGFLLAATSAAAVSAGCGDGDFVPPPPPVSGEAAGAGTTAPAAGAVDVPVATVAPSRRVDFIPSREINPDEAAGELAGARTQAGYDRARLHIWPDDDTANPGAKSRSQVELVRASLAAKPAAMIIDPDDPADKELARAVRDVRSAKIPVVVIGHPIAGSGEPKAAGMAPMILVAPQSFAEISRRIIEASIRNIKTGKLDPTSGAIILRTIGGDRLVPERIASLRKALTDAKITAISELNIPKDLETGSAALKKRLLDDRKPVMVLFTDYNGALVSNKVAGEISESRPYVQAGYSSDENRTRMTLGGNYAAVGDFDPIRLVRKAVTVAVNAAHGREAKNREELLVNIMESPAGTGLPRVQAKREAMLKSMQGEKGD